ncbi:hypothetical protein CRENBAI_004862 [Crenichthys baileyi]|uniref:Uncharacterized protein n=1 Tax=Crenichthys baileyi TaxID=28760 RepID=A0AAV9RNC4_9TELE
MLRKRCPGRRSLKKRPQSTSGKENRFTRVVKTASLQGTFLEHCVRLQDSERESNNAEPRFAYPPNLKIMDLVSWSLNVIDQIFSTGRQGKGEPSCPDGTFFSGYKMDSWQQWKIVCLTTMSVADVENVYISGLLITGFRLFGVGGYLAYRVIRKTWAAVQSIPKLPAMLDGVCRGINTPTEMLREQNRKLDTIRESQPGSGWTQRLKDIILEKLYSSDLRKVPEIWLFGFAIETYQ